MRRPQPCGCHAGRVAVIDYLGVLQDPGFVAAAGREGERSHCSTCNLQPQNPPGRTPHSHHPTGMGINTCYGSPGAFSSNPARSAGLGRAQEMDAATWDMDNWAGREAGGFGVTLGQHVVGQPGTLEVQRAVPAMQDGKDQGPRLWVLTPQELPTCPASHLMCMRFSSMLQGVWGVTGTGIPCFCQETGSRGEPTRRESQPSPAPAPAGISPKSERHNPWPPARQHGARRTSVSLTLGNISSHHEGHLDGDIRDTVWLGGERPPQPCHKLRRSPRAPHEPKRWRHQHGCCVLFLGPGPGRCIPPA